MNARSRSGLPSPSVTRAPKLGRIHGPRAGFTVETQHLPAAPGRRGFAATIQRPGSEHRSRTVFAFGVIA